MLISVQFRAQPTGWTESENLLLQHGLKHYGAHNTQAIRKYFLPAKSLDNILEHIRVSSAVPVQSF